MLRIITYVTVVILFLALISPLSAVDLERDFSGKWVLDTRGTNSRALPIQPDASLTLVQQDVAIRCVTPGEAGPQQRTFLLDGTETRAKIGGDTWSSVAKWEGAALLINTLVTGVHDFTVMDRWKLSRDRTTLIVTRQVVQKSGIVEGELLYIRDRGLTQTETSEVPAQPLPPDPALAPQPIQRRPDPPAPTDYTVPVGTRIPLTLRNNLDTKRANEGDHVYLEVSVPVFAGGRQVIPRGSYVNGVVTQTTAAKGVKGKGQLFIRFDTLTLPNGVQRDFRSKLGSADSGRGKVDPNEGGVTGERDSSGDARTVAIGTGVGAGVGGMAGGAAGHPLGGVGIGAAVGAAAGLATILHDKKADVVLPRGTMLEMVLDRDLVFTPEELRN